MKWIMLGVVVKAKKVMVSADARIQAAPKRFSGVKGQETVVDLVR